MKFIFFALVAAPFFANAQTYRIAVSSANDSSGLSQKCGKQSDDKCQGMTLNQSCGNLRDDSFSTSCREVLGSVNKEKGAGPRCHCL